MKYKQHKSFDSLSDCSENDLWQILLGKDLPLTFINKQKHLIHTLTSITKISQISGISPHVARKIAASLELGRRIFRYIPESPVLNSPLAIYRYVKAMLEHSQEMIRAIYLSSKLTVLRDEIIAIGQLNSAFMGPQELFRPAFLYNAHTFVIVHNHPSGDPTASSEDIALTKYIATTANLLSLTLQDHIIVAQNGFVSLREKYPEIFDNSGFKIQNSEFNSES